MTTQLQTETTEAIEETTSNEETELSTAPEERSRLIATAAYYRAEQRGFLPGGELEDWLEAEKEIDAYLADERETS